MNFFTKWMSKNDDGIDLTAPQEQSGPITAESVIGTDDRVKIDDIDRDLWRPLCCMQVRFGDSDPIVGTGVLIAPNLVLTAAHNIYSLRRKRFISEAKVMVGMKETVAKAETTITKAEVYPGYREHDSSDPDQYGYDFGVMQLASNTLHDWAREVFDVPGQAPLSDADMGGSKITVAGYPFNPRHPQPLNLFSHTSDVLSGTVAKTTVGYDADTEPGQSGGPVFRFNAMSNKVEFVGVHVAGTPHANYARRYNNAMRSQIKTWKRKLGVGNVMS